MELQSCKAEPRLGWTPEFLDEDEAIFIRTIVDLMLPRTDTPGALDVKVDIFIDRVFARLYDEEGKGYIRNQIAEFNQECIDMHGAKFIDLSKDQQIAFMERAELNSGKFSGSVWGTPVGPQEQIGFYRSLKSTAIWAFFSSEEIGKNVLNYDPVPTMYKGCIPLDDVGNRWSL